MRLRIQENPGNLYLAGLFVFEALGNAGPATVLGVGSDQDPPLGFAP